MYENKVDVYKAMSSSSLHLALVNDALTRTMASPSASHCWHYLKKYYQLLNNAVVERAIVQSVRHLPDEGVAGFLRATWLCSVTREDVYCARAGQILQSITPFDPDRYLAFLVFVWGHVLKNTSGRAAFVAAIQGALAPQVLHRLSQHVSCQLKVRPPQRPILSVQKVALIVPYLGAYPHPPTALALQQARIFMEQGIQVEMFSCQDLKVPDMSQFLGGAETNMLAPFDMSVWQAHHLSLPMIRQANIQFSMMGRWAQILKEISTFDPDLVMSVGFYSPLVEVLFQARPVLGLNIHAVAPLDPVDVWLSAFKDDAVELKVQWNRPLPESRAWHHPYRVRRTPPKSMLTRRDLGVPEETIVLVSVGYRLYTEINGEWAATMVAFCAKHPNITWLLVGGSGALPAALERAPAGQIHALPEHHDIPAVLQSCDIYVNPPRMGGGFSVAEAMAEGLPVVAFKGSDGGDKVGRAAVDSSEAYFSKLEALITHADLRQKEGIAMRRLFSNTLDLDQSASSLLAACEHALERFRLRTTQPS